MEISFFNNIKKYNSKSDKASISNVMNEAFRESEEFKNNVNENLRSENRVLIRDFNVLERQYNETEVRSTTKDIVTVVSSVQTGDFEGKTMQDLTYLLSKEDWEEYYKKNLKFLREKLGKNAHCVYATVHFDESTPHLHSMWCFAEVKTTSENFFADFIENLKSKVQELITMRQNSEKASNLNEKQSRQPKTR